MPITSSIVNRRCAFTFRTPSDDELCLGGPRDLNIKSREGSNSGRCSIAAAEGGRSRPPHQRRSLVLYPAVSMVSVGAEGHHGHPSRDARPLASGRLSSLLVLEVAPVWRATADQRGAARLDRANEHREPALGGTAYPRRIAQARV